MESTSNLYISDEINNEELRGDMGEFLGYMVMNYCICGDMCNISGDEGMIMLFNVYMSKLKNRIMGNLDDNKRRKLVECKDYKKVNTIYEYRDNDINFSVSISGRTDMVRMFNNKILVRYGILKRKYDEYYILSSSTLFTWSNVHRISMNDILKFITHKREKILVTNLGILVEIMRLFGYDSVKLDKLHSERDILEVVNNVIYREIYGDFIVILRCIFWMYRKMVVDSIIGDSIREVTKSRMKSIVSKVMEGINVGDMDAVSVGSTKLMSDYDVTLYGNFKLMSEVIREFNRVVEDIYGNTSEVIFDTNVYGTSFIKLSGKVIFDMDEDKYLYKEGGICNGDKFRYMKGDSVEVRDIQHMWAFMKVLKALKMIEKFDVRLYESLYRYMEVNLVEGEYLRKAASFMSFLNKRRDYVGVLGSYGKLIRSLPSVDRVLLSNMYISLVNYYGSETYYTRGAFLDVVVNKQMCGGSMTKCERGRIMPLWMKKKGKVMPFVGDTINLSRSEMVDSVIENIGEMMMHMSREKYVDRVEGGIISLGLGGRVEYCKWLGEMRGIQMGCKEVIESCGVYVMLHRSVWLLVSVFNEYIKGVSREGGVRLGVIKEIRGVI
jgi:hypothetical protein